MKETFMKNKRKSIITIKNKKTTKNLQKILFRNEFSYVVNYKRMIIKNGGIL